MEPLVRRSLELACADGALPWPDVAAVGAWWNRQFDPEVDLVGADRAPVARSVAFAGTVKWIGSPVDEHDVTALRQVAGQVPGFDAGRNGLVVVSQHGVRGRPEGIDVVWGPDEVVAAWRS